MCPRPLFKQYLFFIDVNFSLTMLCLNLFLLFQQRNLYNKIFGGYLMRKAFELAWINATLYRFVIVLMLHSFVYDKEWNSLLYTFKKQENKGYILKLRAEGKQFDTPFGFDVVKWSGIFTSLPEVLIWYIYKPTWSIDLIYIQAYLKYWSGIYTSLPEVLIWYI